MTERSQDEVVLHVMVVSFHHRNGPQVDYCVPPLPKISNPAVTASIPIPNEWSFMPFMCLPDGAHFVESEEFIYFHLPFVSEWGPNYKDTTFGLACFKQIDAKELLNQTADITRTKVQKSVVVLSNQCILSSVRTKLGLVTQAFFAQRDFSKLNIIDELYQTLSLSIRTPVTDTSLYMGLSIAGVVYKFKQKTLLLIKLLMLSKKVVFYGQKVENLSAIQYSLISLFPELLRNLKDVVNPASENNIPVHSEFDRIRSSSVTSKTSLDHIQMAQHEVYKHKLRNLGHPLRIFGQGAFFQPYIPLQQMDVIESDQTKSFVVGTNNSIFLQNKSCGIDAIVHVESGNIDILNPALNSIMNLTIPDKKFIDDIIKLVEINYRKDEEPDQMQFEGSDDDIRAKFEKYVTQLLVSIHYDSEYVSPDPQTIKKVDYISEYNYYWVRAFQESPAYKNWQLVFNHEHVEMLQYIELIRPGHPCHGHTLFSGVSASITAFSKNIAPIQANMAKTLTQASKNVSSKVSEVTASLNDSGKKEAAFQDFQAKKEAVANSASQMMKNVSSWYAAKSWMTKTEPVETGGLLADRNDQSSPEGTEGFEKISHDEAFVNLN